MSQCPICKKRTRGVSSRNAISFERETHVLVRRCQSERELAIFILEVRKVEGKVYRRGLELFTRVNRVSLRRDVRRLAGRSTGWSHLLPFDRVRRDRVRQTLDVGLSLEDLGDGERRHVERQSRDRFAAHLFEVCSTEDIRHVLGVPLPNVRVERLIDLLEDGKGDIRDWAEGRSC